MHTPNFIKRGTSLESRHFRTGQKNILLSCTQCLDSVFAPGFMNLVYAPVLFPSGSQGIQDTGKILLLMEKDIRMSKFD